MDTTVSKQQRKTSKKFDEIFCVSIYLKKLNKEKREIEKIHTNAKFKCNKFMIKTRKT